MSETTGSVNLTVTTEETPSFLDTSVDLRKIARDLTKASKRAVEVLLKLVDSKDERVALQAATKLLEFHVTVEKEISHDQLQRLIAEIKIAHGGTKKVPVGDGRTRPVVDFSRIREIS